MGQRIYPADRLADDTSAALAKDKPVIAVPGQARRMRLIARLLPRLMIRRVERLTRERRSAAASAHRPKSQAGFASR